MHIPHCICSVKGRHAKFELEKHMVSTQWKMIYYTISLPWSQLANKESHKFLDTAHQLQQEASLKYTCNNHLISLANQENYYVQLDSNLYKNMIIAVSRMHGYHSTVAGTFGLCCCTLSYRQIVIFFLSQFYAIMLSTNQVVSATVNAYLIW